MVSYFSLHISETIYKITNHPVHILDKNGEYSPSAFIPFCEFQGNMSVMGVKIDQFDVPGCNSFQEKILNDQLCYEVDLQKFSNNIRKNLKLGFNFLMDYNEDRQVATQGTIKNAEVALVNNLVESNQDQHASIYLETIGEYLLYIQLLS